MHTLGAYRLTVCTCHNLLSNACPLPCGLLLHLRSHWHTPLQPGAAPLQAAVAALMRRSGAPPHPPFSLPLNTPIHPPPLKHARHCSLELLLRKLLSLPRRPAVVLLNAYRWREGNPMPGMPRDVHGM